MAAGIIFIMIGMYLTMFSFSTASAFRNTGREMDWRERLEWMMRLTGAGLIGFGTIWMATGR